MTLGRDLKGPPFICHYAKEAQAVAETGPDGMPAVISTPANGAAEVGAHLERGDEEALAGGPDGSVVDQDFGQGSKPSTRRCMTVLPMRR